jgi:hypothetical protein
MGHLPLENAGVMSEHILSVFKAVASIDERGNATVCSDSNAVGYLSEVSSVRKMNCIDSDLPADERKMD